jgi:hypothetical protein
MKKVCFIGRGPSWKKAPFLCPEYEIWGLTDCYGFIPKADKWFDMHLYEISKNHIPREKPDANHLKEMDKLNIPVYMQNCIAEIKQSIRYPIERMTEKYPNWWTNSLCYMFALAIDEGFEEISIYGVDMANPAEFEHEIPAMAKWIGYCVAKGITVNVPKNSILKNQNYLYGYESIDRQTRRNTYMRCYAGQIPSVMQWLNKNMPKIYEDNKSNMYQMIDIDFRKEGENLGNSKN